MEKRKKLRVGIPRVLNIYTYAPLFNGYLESLGVQPENIIYSDYTSSELYRAGASRGAIDPCFPAKIGISHVYNLIQEKHRKKPLDVIFFPMYDVLTSPLVKIVGANACPTVTATPETVKAAFTKENDVFAENNVKYIDPVLNFADRKLFAHQMLQAFQPVMGLSQEENDRAVEVGFKALEDYEAGIRWRAREGDGQLEREDRIGIVMLGRPYHHDPGLNHEIMEEFQKLGYPIFSQNTLPLDEDLLERSIRRRGSRGRDHSSARHHRRVEEFVLVQHEPQSVGGEVYGPASEPGGAGDFQLQVRPRRADLRRGRGHHRAIRHAVLLL